MSTLRDRGEGARAESPKSLFAKPDIYYLVGNITLFYIAAFIIRLSLEGGSKYYLPTYIAVVLYGQLMRLAGSRSHAR